MSTSTAVELIAEVFMLGAHMCIRDDGELGLLATDRQAKTIRETHLQDRIGEHHEDIRRIIFEGIANVINRYTPALDGIELLTE